MAEPNWQSYLGVITGVIGTITGITGAVMGFIGYRRSNAIKALDLRLELRRTVNEIEQSIAVASGILDRGNKSRLAVMSATGLLDSGAMQMWQQEFRADGEKLGSLIATAPKVDDLKRLSLEKLESLLVESHRFRGALNDVLKKYKDSFAADEMRRQEIRSDMRAVSAGSQAAAVLRDRPRS